MRHAVSPEALAGTWRLVDFRVLFEDGRPDRLPYGEEAEGTVIYGLDGWMSAVLGRGDRAPLGSGRLESYQRAEDTDKIAAFDSYLSYVGRWTLERDEVGEAVVAHEVVQALVPELVGQTLRRRVQLRAEGRQLVLSYGVQPSRGSARSYTLTWERP